MSIGGNDSLFSTIIKDCFVEPALTGVCHSDRLIGGGPSHSGDGGPHLDTLMRNGTDHLERWAEWVIYNTFRRIHMEFPNARVLVTSYTDGLSNDTRSPGIGMPAPPSFGTYDANNKWQGNITSGTWSTCDADNDQTEYSTDEVWDINAEDARYVVSFLERLNAGLERGIKRANAKFGSYIDARARIVSDQFTRFRNNGFCTRNNRILMFDDEAGALQGFDMCTFGICFSTGGWHPNDCGYDLYSYGIASSIEKLVSFQDETKSRLSPAARTTVRFNKFDSWWDRDPTVKDETVAICALDNVQVEVKNYQGNYTFMVDT